MAQTIDITELRKERDKFLEKTERAFRGLFDAARARNELHFALAMFPEFRGMQDPGWSTAQEAHRAFGDYIEFVNSPPDSRVRARVALGFYCHMAEASGFYEIPKNILRVAGGDLFNMEPFRHLDELHKATGNKVAPNANKVIRDLVGHASTIGHHELAEVFRDAFDPTVRNGYSHADYILWKDEIRFGVRRGPFRSVSYPEFTVLLEKGINFFNVLRELVSEYQGSYDPPKVVRAQLADEPVGNWTIACDKAAGTFSITG